MSNHNIRVDAIDLAAEVVELRDTLDAVIEADGRAVTLWRAAHPGNELVVPDRAKLVGWLLEENAALRKDKARLDYIFYPSCSMRARARMRKFIGTQPYLPPKGLCPWRAGIDDAMKEAQP